MSISSHTHTHTLSLEWHAVVCNQRHRNELYCTPTDSTHGATCVLSATGANGLGACVGRCRCGEGIFDAQLSICAGAARSCARWAIAKARRRRRRSHRSHRVYGKLMTTQFRSGRAATDEPTKPTDTHGNACMHACMCARTNSRFGSISSNRVGYAARESGGWCLYHLKVVRFHRSVGASGCKVHMHAGECG